MKKKPMSQTMNFAVTFTDLKNTVVKGKQLIMLDTNDYSVVDVNNVNTDYYVSTSGVVASYDGHILYISSMTLKDAKSKEHWIQLYSDKSTLEKYKKEKLPEFITKVKRDGLSKIDEVITTIQPSVASTSNAVMVVTKKHCGEFKCEGVKKDKSACGNFATYEFNSHLYCGMHCKSKQRVALSPKKKDMKTITESRKLLIDTLTKKVNETADMNKCLGKTGDVEMLKIAHFEKINYKDGVWCVFPINKFSNRKDGFGCSALDHALLGPVKYENITCFNLQNFYEGSAVYLTDLDEQKNLKKEFFDQQTKAFGNAVGSKRDIKGVIQYFYVASQQSGTVGKQYSIMEFRQLYCELYEKFVEKKDDFLKLKQMIADGKNLCICGFNNYDSVDYSDATKTFDYCCVLRSMLIETKYPWVKVDTTIDQF